MTVQAGMMIVVVAGQAAQSGAAKKSLSLLSLLGMRRHFDLAFLPPTSYLPTPYSLLPHRHAPITHTMLACCMLARWVGWRGWAGGWLWQWRGHGMEQGEGGSHCCNLMCGILTA